MDNDLGLPELSVSPIRLIIETPACGFPEAGVSFAVPIDLVMLKLKVEVGATLYAGRNRPGYSVARGRIQAAIFRTSLVALLASCAACHWSSQIQPPLEKNMSRPDINRVLNDHDDGLMAIPGVVGVYVGLKDDDKTPCLKVMVVRKTRELANKLPKNLEGYPVVVEETGVIRPLQSP